MEEMVLPNHPIKLAATVLEELECKVTVNSVHLSTPIPGVWCIGGFESNPGEFLNVKLTMTPPIGHSLTRFYLSERDLPAKRWTEFSVRLAETINVEHTHSHKTNLTAAGTQLERTDQASVRNTEGLSFIYKMNDHYIQIRFVCTYLSQLNWGKENYLNLQAPFKEYMLDNARTNHGAIFLFAVAESYPVKEGIIELPPWSSKFTKQRFSKADITYTVKKEFPDITIVVFQQHFQGYILAKTPKKEKPLQVPKKVKEEDKQTARTVLPQDPYSGLPLAPLGWKVDITYDKQGAPTGLDLDWTQDHDLQKGTSL